MVKYEIYVKRWGAVWKKIYTSKTWYQAKRDRMHYIDQGYKTKIVRVEK